MPSIAIIGTEGSGKTVFAAVWAKRFSQYAAGSPCLIPGDNTTLKYVENIYSVLSNGEWPPSTPSGTIVRLNWKLSLPANGSTLGTIDVQLFDMAGQDIRVLFEQEKIKQGGSLGGELRNIANYCVGANVIVYLVNLKDYIGESVDVKRTANQAALKAAMDYLGSTSSPQQICLLFTQADQYRELAARAGGWDNLARRELPYVYAAHLSHVKVKILPVAAVATTEIAIGTDGKPRRVPTRNFKEAGLNSFMNWMANAIVTLMCQERQIVSARQEEIEEDRRINSEWAVFRTVVGVAVGLVIMLVLLWGWAQYNASDARVSEALAQQQKTLSEQQQQAVAQAQAAAQAQLQQQAQAAATALAQQQHDAEVQQIYKLQSWTAATWPFNDSITFTNGSEYDLTNVTLTIKYVLNGQTGTFQLTAPEIGAQQTCEWDGEQVEYLHHAFDAGPVYKNCSLVCDQTR